MGKQVKFSFRCEYTYGKLRFYPLDGEAECICKIARRACLTLAELEDLASAFNRDVSVLMERPVTVYYETLEHFKQYAPVIAERGGA